ncbi:MAG: hypothetical protein ACM3S5_13930 [Rhodospirillales bacterium]
MNLAQLRDFLIPPLRRSIRFPFERLAFAKRPVSFAPRRGSFFNAVSGSSLTIRRVPRGSLFRETSWNHLHNRADPKYSQTKNGILDIKLMANVFSKLRGNSRKIAKTQTFPFNYVRRAPTGAVNP